MDWFLERLENINPTLDYRDRCNHADDFKKLVDLKIIKYTEQLEIIECDFCDESHLIAPFGNDKNEIVLSCSGSRRVVDPDELKIWTINRDILVENVKSKNPVVDKNRFEQTAFSRNNSSQKGNGLYITKDDSGNYLFDGNPVYIKSKNAQYVVIFDVAYSLKSQGGKIEYSKIIGQCKKRGKTIDKRAILRALTGKDANLFKYIKSIILKVRTKEKPYKQRVY